MLLLFRSRRLDNLIDLARSESVGFVPLRLFTDDFENTRDAINDEPLGVSNCLTARWTNELLDAGLGSEVWIGKTFYQAG